MGINALFNIQEYRLERKIYWLEKQLNAYRNSGLLLKDIQNFAQAQAEERLILPPCKIGDIAYEPNKNKGIISEYEITKIIISKDAMFFKWRIKSGVSSFLKGFSIEHLGKTVFLSLEPPPSSKR